MLTFSGKCDGFTYRCTYSLGMQPVTWEAEVSRFGQRVGHVHGRMLTTHFDNTLFVEEGLQQAVAIDIDVHRADWDYEDIRALHEIGRHQGVAYRVTIMDTARGNFFFVQAAVEQLPPVKASAAPSFRSAVEAFAHGHGIAKALIET